MKEEDRSKIWTLTDGTEMHQDDMYVKCYTCGRKIELGEDFQYTYSGYDTYCNSLECTEGVATHGSCLEYCWFG